MAFGIGKPLAERDRASHIIIGVGDRKKFKNKKGI
jgi:hypothetical protein